MRSAHARPQPRLARRPRPGIRFQACEIICDCRRASRTRPTCVALLALRSGPGPAAWGPVEWAPGAGCPTTVGSPTVAHEGAEDFRRQVAGELERLEALAHAEMQKQGLRFLGATRACEVSPYDRATSFEPLRDRNPTFAVGEKQDEALKIAAAAAVSTFRAAYRTALGLWCRCVRSIAFPAGTWWMRVFYDANIAAGVDGAGGADVVLVV